MRILVTGAAGFVGSHAARWLHEASHDVVAADLVPRESATRLADLLDRGVRYVAGDLAQTLPDLMPGVMEIWHFAANADIPLGARDTSVDLRESVSLTQLVLEAMRASGVPRILFASTSGVYGNRIGPVARESDGPLLPVSLYAAGKLAAEGLISSYAHMFGLQALVFRLGNVVGGGMARGIVRDFIMKLSADPQTVHVLGDGRQRKSYVLIDDVLAGMRWIADHQPEQCAIDVYNLAAGDSLDVIGVAGAVAAAMGIPAPRIVAGPMDSLSWPGDQPVIELSIDRARRTGWEPTADARSAVGISAGRLLDGARQVAHGP